MTLVTFHRMAYVDRNKGTTEEKVFSIRAEEVTYIFSEPGKKTQIFWIDKNNKKNSHYINESVEEATAIVNRALAQQRPVINNPTINNFNGAANDAADLTASTGSEAPAAVQKTTPHKPG